MLKQKGTDSLAPYGAIIAAAVVLTATLAGRAEQPYPVEWTRQLGTPEGGYAGGVSANSLGHIFIAGTTYATLGGPNAGYADAFVSKYDSWGSLLWTRQLGTQQNDYGSAVAADPLGNVFISGMTNEIAWGALLAKYDPSGNLLWTRHPHSVAGSGVATDRLGNAFITGYVSLPVKASEVSVMKYDPSGNLLWTRVFGTRFAEDRGRDVAVDPLGNVLVTGFTAGSLAGPNPGGRGCRNAFVAKYDPSGKLLWMRQLGTASGDAGSAVAADPLGNVFISGHTGGSLGGPNAGLIDAFVAKYDPLGKLLWTRQLGTQHYDRSSGVATDPLGNAFISGWVGNPCCGPGSEDAFVAKYDPSGNLLWLHEFGTPFVDRSLGVTVDPLGDVYLTGYTRGTLGGANQGFRQAFLVKLAVPEPATLALLALGGLGLLQRRRRNGR